jgi:hypothetical protein
MRRSRSADVGHSCVKKMGARADWLQDGYDSKVGIHAFYSCLL